MLIFHFDQWIYQQTDLRTIIPLRIANNCDCWLLLRKNIRVMRRKIIGRSHAITRCTDAQSPVVISVINERPNKKYSLVDQTTLIMILAMKFTNYFQPIQVRGEQTGSSLSSWKTSSVGNITNSVNHSNRAIILWLVVVDLWLYSFKR